MTPPASTILDFEQACTLLRSQASALSRPRRVELLPLLESHGRVLAEPIVADRDQPPFSRSARDGFAVRAADFSSGRILRVIGGLRAGSLWTGPALAEAEAMQIMTGAPAPAGADSIAMVEHIVRSGETIRAAEGRTLIVGENIVPQGSEARAGAPVLAPGAVLGPAELALAASCGYARLTVYARPRVAIVATGDELVELDQTPTDAQIRNSNSYALAALVTRAGGEPVRLPIAPDERKATEALIAEARDADLIVLSGGVSMGEFDLVEDALLEAGAEFLCTGVRMQPGRPVVFGRFPSTGQFFFGLPGNPISVQVTFQCFAGPLLRALAGEPAPEPHWAQATLAEAVAAKPGLTRLLPARLTGTRVQLVGWQGSGDLTANARGNCYAELLPGETYGAGDIVRILLR